MIKAFMNNFRKPSGFLGSLVCQAMNLGHGPLARDVFKHFTITPGMEALDIGCGGGCSLHIMLERGAKASGVDYSATSVARATSKVATYIERGMAKIDCASVQALPYENESFDLITAFETIYFWPDIETSLKEVFRVLRPGGRFVAAVEAWMEDGDAKCPAFFLQNLDMTLYGPEEFEKLLLAAEFSTVGTIRAQNGKWLAMHGEKKAATQSA